MEASANPFDRRLLFDHPDPYPLFRMLRQSQPVFATTHLGRPTFLLTTYDDCLMALKDAETYSSRSNAEAGQVLGRTVLEMDGREHGRHRALVQPAFVPKALYGLEPLLEEIVHGPGLDLLRDHGVVANPLPFLLDALERSYALGMVPTVAAFDVGFTRTMVLLAQAGKLRPPIFLKVFLSGAWAVGPFPPSATGSLPDAPRAKRNCTDGRALPGVELRLVDDSGRDVAPGDPGEIWSRGPDLCAGYTDPRLTRDAFDAQGWYASGDIGVLDGDGYLTITDRKKDIIIRGGANISAAEIEELLVRMPGVAEVAVVAAPDPRLGEYACAFVRPRPGELAPDLESVRLHLESTGLARPKWPEELRTVDEFPRTPSGKIKKFVLRETLRATPGRRADR